MTLIIKWNKDEYHQDNYYYNCHIDEVKKHNHKILFSIHYEERFYYKLWKHNKLNKRFEDIRILAEDRLGITYTCFRDNNKYIYKNTGKDVMLDECLVELSECTVGDDDDIDIYNQVMEDFIDELMKLYNSMRDMTLEDFLKISKDKFDEFADTLHFPWYIVYDILLEVYFCYDLVIVKM
jgi:hypothetical protein